MVFFSFCLLKKKQHNARKWQRGSGLETRKGLSFRSTFVPNLALRDRNSKREFCDQSAALQHRRHKAFNQRDFVPRSLVSLTEGRCVKAPLMRSPPWRVLQQLLTVTLTTGSTSPAFTCSTKLIRFPSRSSTSSTRCRTASPSRLTTAGTSTTCWRRSGTT